MAASLGARKQYQGAAIIVNPQLEKTFFAGQPCQLRAVRHLPGRAHLIWRRTKPPQAIRMRTNLAAEQSQAWVTRWQKSFSIPFFFSFNRDIVAGERRHQRDGGTDPSNPAWHLRTCRPSHFSCWRIKTLNIAKTAGAFEHSARSKTAKTKEAQLYVRSKPKWNCDRYFDTLIFMFLDSILEYQCLFTLLLRICLLSNVKVSFSSI